MLMNFRVLMNSDEMNNAAELIGKIDRGERRIFEVGESLQGFDGCLRRLYYSDGKTIGVYSSCILNNALHAAIAFNTDLPDELHNGLKDLIVEDCKYVKGKADLWYRPENIKVLEVLKAFPNTGKPNSTHELKVRSAYYNNLIPNKPDDWVLRPFELEYLDEVIDLLDSSLAHTFADTNTRPFRNNREINKKEWVSQAEWGEFDILYVSDNAAGVYILKGAEIDIIAVSPQYQRRGIGRVLLHHAVDSIKDRCDEEPFLYCVDSNSAALRFYLREGLTVTGHSGNICLSK